MGCPAPEIPTNVQISCSPVSTLTPYPPGVVCTFSCDEGHELQGALSMECENRGQWTSAPPTCTGIHTSSFLKIYWILKISNAVLINYFLLLRFLMLIIKILTVSSSQL